MTAVSADSSICQKHGRRGGSSKTLALRRSHLEGTVSISEAALIVLRLHQQETESSPCNVDGKEGILNILQASEHAQ